MEMKEGLLGRRVSPEGRWLLAAGAIEVTGLAILGCAAYCIWLWPKPQPPVWQTFDVAITCWLYCSTYHPLWGALTLLLGGLTLVAGTMVWRRHPWANRLAAAVGVVTLPAGLLTILAVLFVRARS